MRSGCKYINIRKSQANVQFTLRTIFKKFMKIISAYKIKPESKTKERKVLT